MDAGIPTPRQGDVPVRNGERQKKKKSNRPWKGGRWKHVFAALDLGTNNCRLLIARPLGRGFRVIDGFSRIVRLGEGLGENGRLSPNAMDRTIDALSICARKMDIQGVSRGHLVATEACRLAENGDEFLQRVKDETGIELDVITPEVEARLAVAGCTTLIDRKCSRVLVFDIGGGSTELIWLEISNRHHRHRPKILAWTSLPAGVVNLAEKFGGVDVSPDAYETMVTHVMSLAEEFYDQCKQTPAPENGPDTTENMHLLGTSGTVTTLGGIHLGLSRYERRHVDGIWMDITDAEKVVSQITSLSHTDRVAQPCIGTERADLVIPGCAIFEAIMRLWPAERVRIADRGLREGMLHSMMTKADQERGWKKRKSRKSGKPSTARHNQV